jgi:hypothetical protein
MWVLVNLFPVILGLPIFLERCEDDFVRTLRGFGYSDALPWAEASALSDFIQQSPLFLWYLELLSHASAAQFRTLYPALFFSFPFFSWPAFAPFTWRLLTPLLQWDRFSFAALPTLLSHILFLVHGAVLTSDQCARLLTNLVGRFPASARRGAQYHQLLAAVVAHAPPAAVRDCLLRTIDVLVEMAEANRGELVWLALLSADDALVAALKNARWRARCAPLLRGFRR